MHIKALFAYICNANKIIVLFEIALLLTFCSAQAQGLSPTADNNLRTFLKGYTTTFGKPDPTTRYTAVDVKTNTIGGELIVYLSGDGWCGSGGCLLLVLEPHDQSFRVIGRTTLVRKPIRILDRTTFDHPDIGVWTQGGGVQSSHETELAFDGAKYTENPTLLPETKAPTGTTGKVIISREDEGLLLYNDR